MSNGLGRGLFQLVKETAKMSKVITTEMLNPFHWAKSKKDYKMMVERKVPGALDRMEKGEIIPEWEYVTEGKLGWEYRQVLAGNPDPWCVEGVFYPRTDHTRPHIIYTMEDYRVIGCVDCMDDQHYINYMLIRVNEMGRCRDCGSCYACVPHPEPDLIWEDPVHH
ncbi:uncharacterized protein LOC134811879 [Bolinopsis microptera]|uniref:uncharacterized protein LOC134811879 n=1 Tax=Bolinopsis microptera TaxID=2820187 RepID=UPI003079D4B6